MYTFTAAKTSPGFDEKSLEDPESSCFTSSGANSARLLKEKECSVSLKGGEIRDWCVSGSKMRARGSQKLQNGSK